MNWNSKPLLVMALGPLLLAMNAMAALPPTALETVPLQFTSGGHIVGFSANELVVASGSHALRVEFVGAQGVDPIAAGQAVTDGKAAPLTRVTYPGNWQGITLAYDAPGGILRSTYTVGPGADPDRIRLRYNAPVAVQPSGELKIAFATGEMRESAPVAWQDISGRRVPVSVMFRAESDREVGFALGPYNEARPLIIDPTLTWNTFLGGPGGEDYGTGIALDASGNAYVTGWSQSAWGTPIRPWAGLADAFVAKLDSNGALLWHTFLGGAAVDDIGYGIAADAVGNAYVTGWTGSTWGAPIRPWSGNHDAFAAKLDGNGVLIWNTFLGGGGNDYGTGIAVDASGQVSITGRSNATWGAPIRAFTEGVSSLGQATDDVLVAKLDASGALLWNTFLGEGATDDRGSGIATDASANVYVTGDAFAAKFDPNGVLVWDTLLWVGANIGSCESIAVDASGNVVVTGLSIVTWGAPVRGFSESSGIFKRTDAFVARLDGNGILLWNTFLGGGAGDDSGFDIATDASGNVYVTGESRSTWGAPILLSSAANPADTTFVVRLDSNGALLWNSFLGGTRNNLGVGGIAVDANGTVYLTGNTRGSAWGNPIRAFSGGLDAFVAKLINTAPVAADRMVSTPIDTAKSITLSAKDADGDPMIFAVATFPAHGVLSGTAPNLTYLPALGFRGTDSFTFTASDGFGHTVAVTMTIAVHNVTVTNDFDGDRRSDIGAYFPPGGNWYGFNSGNGFWQTQFGYAGTIPVTGDFDGDGKSDFGVYFPDTGSWNIFRSTEGSWQTQFGYAGTIPVVGDFDSDGRDDIGCYYPPGGNWYVFRSTEGFWQTTFGYAGTIPIVGDFDGDGRDDIACYFPPGGNWYVFRSSDGFWQSQFGYAGTIPVVGDFDGDGLSDIGVYDPPAGAWYLFKSTEGFLQTSFGYAGTEPVVGDFDGDGRSDLGAYYPPGGNWYVFRSTEGFWQTQFGYEGTIPLGGTLR